jgi:hypothetical protein
MSAQLRVLLIVLCFGMVSLASCAAGPGTATDKSVSVNEQAALEATAIIQRAEATALVLQAQAKATALIQNAGAPPVAPAAATATAVARVAEATRVPTPSSVASQATEIQATPGITATDKASLSRVELLRVDFAAEGKYIYVEFRAPPRVARQWRQGNVSVIDEATGIIYNGIPVAPIIGPLIAQPVREGQIGYVMLTNDGLGIKSGSVVTVMLGDFKQEHVTVK